MSAETRLSARLAQLGIQMPPPPAAKGLYKTVVFHGRLAYVSGHLPVARLSEASSVKTATWRPAAAPPSWPPWGFSPP